MRVIGRFLRSISPPFGGNDALSGNPATYARRLDALAEHLQDLGIEVWLSDPHRLAEGILNVEKAWALRRNPDTAIQLGVMYDLANRHQDALVVYREAFHLFPEHKRLRYEAGNMLLRHGQAEDSRDYFHSVLSLFPDDQFARFYAALHENFPNWVDGLEARVRSVSSERRTFVLACSVWGARFAGDFIRYLCASLLVPGNLPALAKQAKVVFLICATEEAESTMRASELFTELATYASIHFVRYRDEWIDASRRMNEFYGEELGPYYARNCKYLLFSCAHYLGLAVGHQLDAMVMPLCADVFLTDDALTQIAKLVPEMVDIVAYGGINLPISATEAAVDCHRDTAGRLSISAKALVPLIVAHLPRQYFADARSFTNTPLMVCWKVGDNALLIHQSHYHPVCIRAAALRPPFELTIDPVDSRFLEKRYRNPQRIHLIRDSSMVFTALEDLPTGEDPAAEPRLMSAADVGLWLWQCWGFWRALNFAEPIAVIDGEKPAEWEAIRAEAASAAAKMMAVAKALEESNYPRKTWKILD